MTNWLAVASLTGADRLLLIPGRPPLIMADGVPLATRFMNDPALTREEIEEQMREITPPRYQQMLNEYGSACFRYEGKGLGPSPETDIFARCSVQMSEDGLVMGMKFVNRWRPSLKEVELDKYAEIFQASHGLILFGGRPDSGRTTNLTAVADYLSQMPNKVIVALGRALWTRFDPKSKSPVIQREYFTHVPYLVKALSEARDLPANVVIVDRLGCLEDVATALRLAECCLVITTFTASSVPQMIQSLVGVFPTNDKDFARQQLALQLRLAIVQDLIVKASGRALAREIFVGNSIANQTIADNDLPGLVEQLDKRLDDSLETLREDGEITAEDVERHSVIYPDFDAK